MAAVLVHELTNLKNPNSAKQVKDWLAANGLETDTLGKKTVAELIKTAPPLIAEVLKLRQALSKSSIAKYDAMKNCVCADGRVRGLFQFYGASRTGRWAGKLLQPQNLPQNHLADLDAVRELVRHGDGEALNILYDNIPDVLSQLLRTTFVPKIGRKFIVADFSSIEAIILAWLAGEGWVMRAYADERDLYIENAEKMFHAPKGSVDKKSPLRQKSKVAVLACGYGGSVGALKAFGALDLGLKESELKPIVDAWRAANPNIVKFWWDVDRAAIKAVRERVPTAVGGIKFIFQNGMLLIVLPSGRRLAYSKPCIGTNRFGGDCLTFEGVGDGKKWERQETYGAKLVENIVQATARDILAHALGTFRSCDIVLHIHDEIVIEADERMSLPVVLEQMCRVPPWAKGLTLKAAGFECKFYQKD